MNTTYYVPPQGEALFIIAFFAVTGFCLALFAWRAAWWLFAITPERQRRPYIRHRSKARAKR